MTAAGDRTVATWTFDLVSVFTVRVCTDRGERAARDAVEGLREMPVEASREQGPEVAFGMPGDCYEPVCVAPRGRAYLVRVAGDDGSEGDGDALEELGEPLDGSFRRGLADAVAAYREAAGRPSGNAGRAAASDLASAVEALLAGP